jgi:hypothetical protein
MFFFGGPENCMIEKQASNVLSSCAVAIAEAARSPEVP